MKLTKVFSCAMLAMGAAVAGHAAAQSGATLYGIADIGIDYADNQKGGANRYVRSGNASGSRFGVRGDEDLGDDLHAVYLLEGGFTVDTGEQSSAGTLFNRQAYVGLRDRRAGTLTVGRQYTPYYWFVGGYSAPAYMGGSVGAQAGDIDGLDQALRINNSVSYLTPAWRGLQLGVMAAPGETAGSTARGGAYSVAAKYADGAWGVAVGHQVLKNGASRTGWDSTAASSFIKSAVNAGYLSAAAIAYNAAALQYETRHLTLAAVASNVQYRPDDRSVFANVAIFNSAALHGKYAVTPALTLMTVASYTRQPAANGIATPASYRQLSFEQRYALSQRTAIYLMEAQQWSRGNTLDASGGVVRAVATVGDGQASTPSSDGRQLMLSIGLRHAF